MVNENKELKDKPVQTIKDGALELAVWLNERVVDGETKSFHSITFTRNYKDKDGVWQQTTALGQYDLLKMSNLLVQVHNALNLKQSFSDSFVGAGL